TIQGEVRFPGVYTIKRGETLHSVLLRAGGLSDLAFPEGSIFLREELRQREQQQLDALATRMRSDIAMLAVQAAELGARTGQGGGGGAAVAGLGDTLLSQLLNTKAVGRLVVNINNVISGPPGGVYDVVLKNADKLLIPRKTQEVTVFGEVQNST